MKPFEQCLPCPFVSERMMEEEYHLEQHIERLCASQICDSHTKSLLAAAVVAVAAAQTTCENVVTSLGDQGVMFHIASFEHHFSFVHLLATFLSCTSSFYVSIALTSVNLTLSATKRTIRTY